MTTQLKGLLDGFRLLKLGKAPVVVHASLKAFGHVDGGAETVVEALVRSFPAVLAPVFTYKTMVTPGIGPEKNAIVYGSGQDANRMAEFFRPDMPADPLMGIIPETLRLRSNAGRSGHPILSFAGIHADAFLDAQTMAEPLGPLGALEQAGGWALLLGVNHTANTSIHYAEKRSGRRTFVRWALTPQGVRECPSFPGCSAGFETTAPEVERHTRRVKIGNATVQAVPLKVLFKAVKDRINKDPLALLCQQEDCERCGEIRKQVIRD
jgi:aminoglycoside 3-N-acetyltransferase